MNTREVSKLSLQNIYYIVNLNFRQSLIPILSYPLFFDNRTPISRIGCPLTFKWTNLLLNVLRSKYIQGLFRKCNNSLIPIWSSIIWYVPDVRLQTRFEMLHCDTFRMLIPYLVLEYTLSEYECLNKNVGCEILYKVMLL